MKKEKNVENKAAENVANAAKPRKKSDYGLTDEQVESEIARLNASPEVALARHEQRLKYRRRQYLYTLRDFEKRGKALTAAGVTRQVLDERYKNGTLDIDIV